MDQSQNVSRWLDVGKGLAYHGLQHLANVLEADVEPYVFGSKLLNAQGALSAMSEPAAMRRLPVAVLFNRYPLLMDVLEPILRGRIEIAARATTPAETERLLDEHEPDLLLAGVEVASKADDVLRLVRDARARHRGLKVIAFSSGADSGLVADALDAGVSAVIAPNASLDDIAVAIRQATDPSIHLAPAHLPAPKRRPAPENGEALTDREIETVRLVAKGLSNAEVGRQLVVTEQTVKFHLSNIFRKLDVSNRTQATRRAEALDLLDEGDHQASALGP